MPFILDELSLFTRHEVERDKGRTLRHIEYDHRLSYRKVYEVVIGADVCCNPVVNEYLQNFWIAEARYISFEPISGGVPDDDEFIAVTTEGGISPEEFIENHDGLPSWPLTLVEKYPRG